MVTEDELHKVFKSEKYYLGLDQSLTNTGFAIVIPEKALTYYGVIKTRSNKPDVDRWLYIERSVESLIAPGLAEVFMERIFFSSSTAKAAQALIQVDTILRRLFSIYHLEISQLSPRTWRSVLGFSGKKDPQLYFGIENSHAADAISICYAGLANLYPIETLCSFKRDLCILPLPV